MPVRKSYAGGAVPTSISSGAFNVGATTLTLTVATGWPTTTNGPFVATIDRGLATQEKILIAARAGLTCSSITRGYDGTSEVIHGSNAPIEHCLDAVTLDEANRLSSLLTTKGDDLGHDGTQVQRLGVGAAGTYLTATPAAATGKSWTAAPSSLVTAKGQVLAASASGVLVPTNTPTSGQLLIGDSTQTAGVRWGQLPTLAVRRVAAQSIAHNSVQDMVWDTEDQDSDNYFAVSSADLVGAAVSGVFLVTFNLDVTNYATFGGAGGVPNADRMYIYDAFGTGGSCIMWPHAANAAGAIHSFTALIRKGGGGGIRCGVVQESGAAVNMTGSALLVRVSL